MVPKHSVHPVAFAFAFVSLPFGSCADGNALTLEIFAQTVVKLCQPPQLQVGHGLFRFLDLRGIADIA